MAFDRRHLALDPAMPTATETVLDMSLSLNFDEDTCPNVVLVTGSVTPNNYDQVYGEKRHGERWYQWDWNQPDPIKPAASPVIGRDGLFYGNDTVTFPGFRIVARDGYRGGKVELIGEEYLSGWYDRQFEKISGYVVEESSDVLTVRAVISGPNLTDRHRINGATAFGLYTLDCELRIWRNTPTWDGTEISEAPDIVLDKVGMTLVETDQTHYTVDYDLDLVSPPIDPPLSGTIYVQPVFDVNYTDDLCATSDGPVPDGQGVVWTVECLDGEERPVIRKVTL